MLNFVTNHSDNFRSSIQLSELIFNLSTGILITTRVYRVHKVTKNDLSAVHAIFIFEILVFKGHILLLNLKKMLFLVG